MARQLQPILLIFALDNLNKKEIGTTSPGDEILITDGYGIGKYSNERFIG